MFHAFIGHYLFSFSGLMRYGFVIRAKLIKNAKQTTFRQDNILRGQVVVLDFVKNLKDSDVL